MVETIAQEIRIIYGKNTKASQIKSITTSRRLLKGPLSDQNPYLKEFQQFLDFSLHLYIREVAGRFNGLLTKVVSKGKSDLELCYFLVSFLWNLF